MLRSDLNYDVLDDWDRQSKKAKAKLMISCFEALTTDSSVEDVREMLVKMAPGVKDEFGSHVANSEEAVEIWGELIITSIGTETLGHVVHWVSSLSGGLGFTTE
jgi:hypothetical protein